MITIFENILSKDPKYTTVEKALERIKEGKSKNLVELVRNARSKDEANEFKKKLPSVCFSGKFGKNRKDEELESHSNLICLDFDNVDDVDRKKEELMHTEQVYAAWVSPSGKGVKALVKIADGSHHKEHFDALLEDFSGADKSGRNLARVCYESYDPEIFINPNAKVYTKAKKVDIRKIENKAEPSEVFKKLLTWMSSKSEAFVTGSRNIFIFKLAAACCRFGMDENECLSNLQMSVLGGSDFPAREAISTIRSAYRSNSAKAGSACFTNDRLVDKSTNFEVEVTTQEAEENIEFSGIIFGEEVKEKAMSIYDNGYESANTTYLGSVDNHFKFKKGETTLFSGIGNYGKSTWLKYMMLAQTLMTGFKWALFVPEDFPAEEFYHALCEMYFGQSCVPSNKFRPSRNDYNDVYDWITKHFFFVYPKKMGFSPNVITGRFLECIVKLEVGGCVIDPWNKMTNDYASVGGRDDKYLESMLGEMCLFGSQNQIYNIIVAHPKLMRPDENKNFPCPTWADLAGGAMWNNMMDNIIFYHRPNRGADPNSKECMLNFEKIKRQNIVGKPGILEFELSSKNRRFIIDGRDYLGEMITGGKTVEKVTTEIECPF